VKKAREEFEDIKTSQNIINRQAKKKWDIVNHHFQQSSFYHSFIGMIPNNWEEIPILTKNDLNQINHKKKLFNHQFIRQTSGSTGRPLVFAIDSFSHAMTWTLIANRYNSLGISLNDKQARFYGAPPNFSSKLFERTKDFLGNRYRMPVKDLSDESLENWITILQKKKLAYLYGYSYPLITFAHFLTRKGIFLKTICPDLKACIVTSEMCSPAEEKLMEKQFGIPCANEYGASEIGIIGFGKTNNWRISDEEMYIEIVDDQGEIVPHGTLGRVICTNFYNTSTPFIRYDVGDYGKITLKDNRHYLTELLGRKEEMAILSSGQKSPGDTVFYHIMQHFAKKYPLLKEYKIIQHTISTFEIILVANTPLTQKQKDFLIQLTYKGLNKDIKVIINEVPAIERTVMGKFRRFVSKVPNE